MRTRSVLIAILGLGLGIGCSAAATSTPAGEGAGESAADGSSAARDGANGGADGALHQADSSADGSGAGSDAGGTDGASNSDAPSDAAADAGSTIEWEPWVGVAAAVPSAEATTCMATFAGQDLDAILAGCPQLATRMIWTTGAGANVAYAAWTSPQKAALRAAFDSYLAGNFAVPATCPDPFSNMDPNFQFSGNAGPGFLAADAAFEIYAAYVAHAIYLEVTQAVPWSILDMPTQERDELLAAASYHSVIRPSDNALPAHIVAGRDYQLPFSYEAARGRMCRPHDGYTFARGATSTSHRDLVENDALQTLANLSLWAADNVAHGPMPANMQHASGYPYYLQDLLEEDGVITARIGCHSMAAILQELGRSVNIPLLNVATVDFGEGYFGSHTHRGLVYGWGGSSARILEHTDDLYAMGLRPFGAAAPVRAFSSDIARKYFLTTWRTPASLSASGYLLQTNYPVVIPNEGYAVGGPISQYENRYDYGRVLGTWPFDVLGRSRAWRTYTAEQEEQLCSEALLKTYCDLTGISAGPSDFQAVMQGSRPNFADLDVATRAWNRMAACASAAGGCSAAITALEAYPQPKQADTTWSAP